MSNFEIFSCHANMLNAINSSIEQNFLIDLYCSSNFFAIDYVKIFYWFSGKSFVVIILLILLVALVLLLVMTQLIKKVLVPNIVNIKKRWSLSPFLVAVIILSPLNHSSMMFEDHQYVMESDFYIVQYVYLVGNILLIVGLAAPVMMLVADRPIKVPYYAIYVCLFFSLSGLFLLYLWAMVGVMHWAMPVIHFVMFGLFVYMSFWAKNKDSDYERMIAERDGLIDDLGSVVENDYAEENNGPLDEFNPSDYLQNEGTQEYNRLEYSDFENGIQDNVASDVNQSDSRGDFRQSNRASMRPKPNNNKHDLVQKLKSDPERSLLLFNKLLDHLENPEHTIPQRLFYLPVNAFILVAVPHSSNPLMETRFKYAILSIVATLMVFIQFPKMHWIVTLGIITALATTFVLMTIFIKSKTFIQSFWDILSFVEVSWVVNFLEHILSDMFYFFEFYFSVNQAVIQGFLIPFKRVSVLFLVSYYLYKSKEAEIAVLNFYTWPVFGLFVNFAVWTIQGLVNDPDKKVRLLESTFNPERDLFDVPGLSFVKWLILFTVITYTVQAFHFLEIGNEPNKRTAKIFLSVYGTFTVLVLFFTFAF
jgi:Ca2+/Na+ antiporter